MSTEIDIQVLRSEIKKGLQVMERLAEYLQQYEDEHIVGKSPGIAEAMVVSQCLSNYYTCSETLFLRISRFFENHLESDRWHHALLEKMCLEIEGVRPRVLSQDSYYRLLELLKFRHFTRYYFELNYDWDKLLFLTKKFEGLQERLKTELSDFDSYLVKLLGNSCDS